SRGCVAHQAVRRRGYRRGCREKLGTLICRCCSKNRVFFARSRFAPQSGDGNPSDEKAWPARNCAIGPGLMGEASLDGIEVTAGATAGDQQTSVSRSSTPSPDSSSEDQSAEAMQNDETRQGLVWRLGGVIKTLRPHQWVKNAFVLAPVVFAREIFDPALLTRAASAFGVFCLLAGAVYTMNDVVDVK